MIALDSLSLLFIVNQRATVVPKTFKSAIFMLLIIFRRLKKTACWKYILIISKGYVLN
jgi:hypothetical protein